MAPAVANLYPRLGVPPEAIGAVIPVGCGENPEWDEDAVPCKPYPRHNPDGLRATPWVPPPVLTKKKGPTVSRWPICGPITKFGSFNWPDIRHLCSLSVAETNVYEQHYFWLTLALEPILARPEYRSNAGYKWPEIFKAFEKRNWDWNEVSTYRSLSSSYDKHRYYLKPLIEAHNSRVENKSLEERKEMTMKFLQLPRKPCDTSETFDGTRNDSDQRFRPLIEGMIVLYDPSTMPAPAQAPVAAASAKSSKPTKQAVRRAAIRVARQAKDDGY